MKTLVFNCGSSSLKFALFASDDAQFEATLRGEVEEIGAADSMLKLEINGEKRKRPSHAADHAAAARAILAEIEDTTASGLDAIAHRIVHGGPNLREPALLNDEVRRWLDEASRFAPLHNPPALAALDAVTERFPHTPQVVVTDTAFHQTLPPVAQTYAIPWELAQRQGVRRYGFHGIGHAWMAQRYAELRNRPVAELNLITLQLGAGCSACAIRRGRSVDTSMGLTPLEGLMMATRSGDLDPAIFSYLAEQEGLEPRAVEELLNRDAGLLGVSGVSGDMREVERAAASNPRAQLALEMFCYRARKYIGAYVAALGKVDAVIFGGGIGEHAPAIREQICGGLERLGIVLDAAANRKLTGGGCFSQSGSQIELWVVPLQEELYIARAAMGLVTQSTRRSK